MTVTNRLKIVREQRGLTQEKLAGVVGVSRQTIIAVEKGNYIPSLLLAMRLARHFNLSVERLFTLQ